MHRLSAHFYHIIEHSVIDSLKFKSHMRSPSYFLIYYFIYFSYMLYDSLSNSTHNYVASVSCCRKQLHQQSISCKSVVSVDLTIPYIINIDILLTHLCLECGAVMMVCAVGQNKLPTNSLLYIPLFTSLLFNRFIYKL